MSRGHRKHILVCRQALRQHGVVADGAQLRVKAHGYSLILKSGC